MREWSGFELLASVSEGSEKQSISRLLATANPPVDAILAVGHVRNDAQRPAPLQKLPGSVPNLDRSHLLHAKSVTP